MKRSFICERFEFINEASEEFIRVMNSLQININVGSSYTNCLMIKSFTPPVIRRWSLRFFSGENKWGIEGDTFKIVLGKAVHDGLKMIRDNLRIETLEKHWVFDKNMAKIYYFYKNFEESLKSLLELLVWTIQNSF